MATTRFKGETASERLTLSSISDNDMIQARHKPGTVDDADKGVSKAILQSCPFGVSTTAAGTSAKVAVLTDSNPDFTLLSGREIVVCFTLANTATNPSLNFAGSGAVPMFMPNGAPVGAWNAGAWMHLKYFSATVDNVNIERWILLNSEISSEIIMASSASVIGKSLVSGSTIKIMFTAALTGSDTTTALSINYNGTAYAVKVCKNGALSNFVASQVSSSYIYVQAYTTLELAFDGSQFIIVGNPVVVSSADYTIYADGSKKYNTSEVDNLLNDKLEANYWTLFSELAPSEQTVMSTYGNRKFSDYTFLIFIIGNGSINSRNSVVIPSTLFRSGIESVYLYAHGSGMVAEVDITCASDTSINIKQDLDTGNPFTACIRIYGI